MHDLGKVVLSAAEGHVSHAFFVTSQSGEPLRITDVKKSCGCVEVNVGEMPDGSANPAAVTITLSGVRTGQRSESVWLLTESDEPVKLTLKAELVLRDQLLVPLKCVHMSQHRDTVEFPVIALKDAPPPLEISTDGGWQATSSSWEWVADGIWRSDVRVSRGLSTGPSEGLLRIGASGIQTIKVPVRSAGW